MASEIVPLHAPREKKLVDQGIHSEAVVGRTAPAPRLASYRSFDVERGRHDRNLRNGDLVV